MNVHSQEYRRVIASPEWRKLRQRLIVENTGCERCFLITSDLELHHKHYETLGKETENDVEVLCKTCHQQADKERAWQTEFNRYHAQVCGWASKKYGHDWEYRFDWSDISSEFDAWLERKGEY